MKKLVNMRNKRVVSYAVMTWKNWSFQLDAEVRIILLKRDFANKFFMTTMFNGLK